MAEHSKDDDGGIARLRESVSDAEEEAYGAPTKVGEAAYRMLARGMVAFEAPAAPTQPPPSPKVPPPPAGGKISVAPPVPPPRARQVAAGAALPRPRQDSEIDEADLIGTAVMPTSAPALPKSAPAGEPSAAPGSGGFPVPGSGGFPVPGSGGFPAPGSGGFPVPGSGGFPVAGSGGFPAGGAAQPPPGGFHATGSPAAFAPPAGALPSSAVWRWRVEILIGLVSFLAIAVPSLLYLLLVR